MPTQLTLLGLGPAGLSLLSGETIRALEAAPRLILRTGRHPAADELRERGIAFETLDSHYQEAESFGALYPRLAEAVLAAAEAGPLAYAVPGHPLLGEESVRLTLAGARERGITARVLAAPGFVDAVATALAAAGEFPDLTQWQVADGHAAERVWWDTSRPTLVFQVDDAFAASRVKLALLEEYPEQFTVWVVRCAGDPERESVRPVALHALDHAAGAAFDHLTTVYVPALPPELKRAGFPELEQVVARLRAPDGCPWDREQTYGTLKRYVLEEAYEVVEAIEDGDPETLCEELGDLALQVVMLAQLGREEGYFDLRDAAAGITEKLIRRHPHVFGDASAEDAEEVLRNWEAIKRTEKPERTSVLDGVPGSLPALMKALEVSKRVVRVGFEWPTLELVLAKVDEEVAELKAELAAEDRDRDRIRDEIGDLLFTLANVARWLKIDPEEALRRMVDRFGGRFREVERLAEAAGRDLKSMDITELDGLWEQAKASAAQAG